jgi:c-di-GMP-related signal transduction protein
MSCEFLLGRQPILDREEKLFGYALLFGTMESLHQNGGEVGPPLSDHVLVDLMTDACAEDLFGEGKGIVPLGVDLLMSDALAALPANRLILSLIKPRITAELVKRCRDLKQIGFTIALSDHLFDPRFSELYRIVDVIGIDVKQSPADKVDASVRHLQNLPLRLLAEQVDTRDDFAQCRTLGFDFFSGFFFAGPAVKANKKLNETAATLLRIALLIINEAGVEAIVRTVQESPGLTYKLLLQANSAVIGARQEIDSVRHAIMLLGRDPIRRWAQAELMASNGSQERDNPLVEMATVRASFMEHLSKSHPLLRNSRDAADRAFLAGTLSMLETIYNVPIKDVVDSVELCADVKMALLRREGLFGELLLFVEALERLDFEEARKMLPRIKISPSQVLDAQRKSFLRKPGGMNATMA